MTTTRPLTGPLFDAGSRILPRGSAWLKEMMSDYAVEHYAVYIDHTTIESELLDISGCAGYFTFDVTLEDTMIKGEPIALIRLDGNIPQCDGWIVASTSRASAFSLAKALHQNGVEDQVILRMYGGQTTEMSAYMDLFSGETKTMIYLNHYFDRKYRINFPLDIRYKVCRCDGQIVQSGQRVVPPGAITVFDTQNMNLGEFEGYIRVSLEVENLQSRVQPFIHFWADYISDAGICRNHQSGWSPWPPDTVFNRGYLPLNPDYEAIACFYNENETSVSPKILMHYNQNGEEKSVKRNADPIKSGHMSYQNISEIFADVELEGTNAAYVLISCDQPLHRPNYYIAKKGSRQFIDTFHQTGGKACHWAIPSYNHDKGSLAILKKHNLLPWNIRIPILEKRFNLDAYMGLLSLTLSDTINVRFSVLDETGKEVHNAPARLDGTRRRVLDIAEYMRTCNIDIKKGFFCLTPEWDDDCIAKNTCITFGYKHPSRYGGATSFKGSPAEINLPFYFSSNLPNSREYFHSPLQHSDHFAPGIVSDEYDSLLIVLHDTLSPERQIRARYAIEIIDASGQKFIINKQINPLTHDAFWLSELLENISIRPKEGYYTIWIKCSDTKLKPYHGLYRKKDHALSLDDGSEGTLQREPMIGGLKYEEVAGEIERLKEMGVLK